MRKRTPKELLADEQLIGFVKPAGGADQTLWRASSAKVTKPTVHRGNAVESCRSASTDADGDS